MYPFPNWGEPPPVCDIMSQGWFKKDEFPELEEISAGDNSIDR
jgi:hypothetical protein